MWDYKNGRVIQIESTYISNLSSSTEESCELPAIPVILEDKENDCPLPQIDPFNNCPDTTIAILSDGRSVVGIVSILGRVESTVRLGNFSDGPEFFSNQGVVIIARSTKNEIKIMLPSDYEQFKVDEYKKTKI